jgi:hypothetical protein
LASLIRIVIHDNAVRETAQQFDLRLGQARPAAGDDICMSRARHGDRVHIAFDEYREIVLPEAFLGAIEMVEHVALRVDRCLR